MIVFIAMGSRQAVSVLLTWAKMVILALLYCHVLQPCGGNCHTCDFVVTKYLK